MEIVLDRRFRGPLTSANGGYACGSLAAFLADGAVEVTLRQPPPLERPLGVRVDGDTAALLDGGATVAEARREGLALDVPPPVTVGEAQAAATRHQRMGSDVFRECFTCGVRPEGDGLGIYAGPVPGREPLHAAPWTPAAVAPEIVWAAIDCPGAYAVGGPGRGEVVLGRMTARVHRLPEAGRPHVVISWPLGEDGRKLFAGTALFDAGGELLAEARQVWIEPRPPSEA